MMTPATRPSSPRSTTSFDLRSARRHRARWGPLPVWPQLFGASVVRPESVWHATTVTDDDHPAALGGVPEHPAHVAGRLGRRMRLLHTRPGRSLGDWDAGCVFLNLGLRWCRILRRSSSVSPPHIPNIAGQGVKPLSTCENT